MHQKKQKGDPKIILTNTITHEYHSIFKSHTSKVCSGLPISHSSGTKMKQLTWSKLYFDKIMQTTQKTSGVGISTSGIETNKKGTDKVQTFFLEELRNATLELVRSNLHTSGIKISSLRNASFY
jgi:hypothetical protein